MRKILLFGLFSVIALNMLAWDAVGHKIIADIAYHNLTRKARNQCDKTLGEKGIIYYSSWADEVRSDSTYNYSSAWHYQNLAPNLTDSDLALLYKNPSMEGEHAFFAIETMKTRLKRDKNDAEALKFLVHFVGDVHQPMHTGRAEDRGGNSISVTWFRNPTNLHSVWDGRIIEAKRMSYSEYSEYLRHKFAKNTKEFKQNSMLQSIQLVYNVSNKIYNYGVPENTYRYIYDFSDDTDEMLFRAGIILANVLNEIYR